MADSSGIKFIKYYLQKLKSFFLSKDILSFLLFLALSASFWFVHSLGKEHEITIKVPIRFVGLPMNIAITNSPPTEISINVKDQGLRLFYYSKSHLVPLTIDLKRNFFQKGEILITSDQLSGRINRYLHLQPTTAVLEVHPDSLLIQYEKLITKTLPVKLNSKIELAHQYMLNDKIKLEPSQVAVFGPKRVLDNLKSISTELLEKKNLNDTATFQCQLKPINHVRFSSKYTKVSISVEPFTERKVQIPIMALNCPANLAIRTFPAFVNVTYIVGLSQFNSLSPSDIQVYLDYNDLKMSKASKHVLKIKNNTSHISNIRILPQEVEFILEQK
jgi:hypothetical protein